MSEVNSKSPAFPTHTQPGLSKREEFAKAALQGYCANTHSWASAKPELIAHYAVEQADALLDELEKPVGALEEVHVDV